MKAADIRRIFAKPARRTNPNPRTALTPSQRAKVRPKTKGTCHVCGGKVGRDWQADHVVPHQQGGDHSIKNYLPACRECNRLRWSYSSKVLGLIMRVGVYAKHEIRHDTELGRFYLAWPIPQTTSPESKGRENLQTASAESSLSEIARCFSLPWSAYVRLLSVKNENARRFYESEARRGFLL